MKIAVGPSSFAEEDQTPFKRLQAVGAEVVPNPFRRRLNEEETIALLAGVDGLLAGLEPLNRRVLAAAPHLKAIARVGIGMDNVDQKAAAELGIKVSNTPEAPAEAVAEMTVAALLALNRQLVPANTALHMGEWKKTIGSGLKGQKVLLLGFGRIGRRTAELLRVFGAELMACDPQWNSAEAERLGVRRAVLPEALAEADVISLHAAGRDTLLGAAEFARMRPGVALLNSARGDLIDEAALIAALEKGVVVRVWLDVFCEEPYRGVLTKFPQVLLTPHIGTYTRQCRLEMETAAVANLLRDLGL